MKKTKLAVSQNREALEVVMHNKAADLVARGLTKRFGVKMETTASGGESIYHLFLIDREG